MAGLAIGLLIVTIALGLGLMFLLQRGFDGGSKSPAVARSGGPPRSGSPRQREAVAARVQLRSEDAWARLVADAAGLERRARSGPAVGVNDWTAFALRWRLEPARRR